MIIYLLSSLRARIHTTLVILALSLAACDSGTMEINAPIILDDATQSVDSTDENEGEDDALLPDYVIQQLTISPTYTREDVISILLTVANIGDRTDQVPRAWLMVSETEDFSTGYAIYPFNLRGVDDPSLLLEPGEERSFRSGFELPLSRNGLHYARVWLNPDLSAYFMNPEDSVVPSYETREKNTEDNLSELTSFEALGFYYSECPADALEENDTMETAAPILLDTEYLINDCNEQLDVFSINLEQGRVYELRKINNHPTFPNSVSRWPHAIVGPTNRYLERPTAISPLLFQPTSTGTHYLILRHIVHGSGNATGLRFTVNSVPQ